MTKTQKPDLRIVPGFWKHVSCFTKWTKCQAIQHLNYSEIQTKGFINWGVDYYKAKDNFGFGSSKFVILFENKTSLDAIVFSLKLNFKTLLTIFWFFLEIFLKIF